MGGTRGTNPPLESIDSGARVTLVNPGGGSDPPTPFDKPWFIGCVGVGGDEVRGAHEHKEAQCRQGPCSSPHGLTRRSRFKKPMHHRTASKAGKVQSHHHDTAGDGERIHRPFGQVATIFKQRTEVTVDLAAKPTDDREHQCQRQTILR